MTYLKWLGTGMVLLVTVCPAPVQAGGGYNCRFNEVLGFCHLHGWMTVGLDVMPTTGGNYELNKNGDKRVRKMEPTRNV